MTENTATEHMTLKFAVHEIRKELLEAIDHFNAATDYQRLINKEVVGMKRRIENVDSMIFHLEKHAAVLDRELNERRR